MRSYWFIVAAASLAMSGCEKKTDNGSPAADNTKLNERDRGKSITPVDQGNNQADIDTTANIRKALMASDGLSMDAKNVKVITNQGVITLRGPVKNTAERAPVEEIAKNYAGANRVDSQLEVAGPEGATPH